MKNKFIRESLELNLFFLRIMKEHALFLEIAFQPNQGDLIAEAKEFNIKYNKLLLEAIDLSRGIVAITDEMVTKYTLDTERATEFLTGVKIDNDLTLSELSLSEASVERINSDDLMDRVRRLNDRAFNLTMALIKFKTKVLNGVLTCKLYTANYPLLIEHIRREAILFAKTLDMLQRGQQENTKRDLLVEEIFWNRIMAEHSEFIRGFLDPTEEGLIKLANRFAVQFKELNQKALNTIDNVNNLTQFTNESLNLTKEVKGFKVQGTEGILNCKLKSIIFPLLGDHVVREANHFIHILEKVKGV